MRNRTPRADLLAYFARCARRPLIDNVMGHLSYADAARLVTALLDADLPGYRCYMPASLQTAPEYPVARIVEVYGADWPLRDPRRAPERPIDISRITAETGWTPLD